jgi:hypothetical protein
LAVPSPPNFHSVPVFAWNAMSKPPAGRAAMLGLVFAAIPRLAFAVPAEPVKKSAPVFAWNAIWNPPVVSVVMLCLNAQQPRKQGG